MAQDADFGTFGRYRETPIEQMPAEMRDAYEFTRKLRGLVPGPHKIWLANPKLSKAIVPTGAYFQTQSTLTKAEIEIVTNLATARWMSAYASYEHEKIGQEQGHLPAEKVQRIIAGLPTSFEDAREEIVYQLASALVAPRACAAWPLQAGEAPYRRFRHRRCCGADRVVHHGERNAQRL